MRTRAVVAALLVSAGLLFWLRAGMAPGAPPRSSAAPAAETGGGGHGEGSVREQGVVRAGDDAAPTSGDAGERAGEGADPLAGDVAHAADPAEDDAEDQEDQPPEELRDEVQALRQAMEHQAMLRLQQVVLAERAQQGRLVADANEDGELDVLDLAVFLQWLEAGDMRADFSGDGALDHMDSVAFQSDLAAQTREAAPDQLAQLEVARAMAQHQETVVFELRTALRERIHLMELDLGREAGDR